MLNDDENRNIRKAFEDAIAESNKQGNGKEIPISVTDALRAAPSSVCTDGLIVSQSAPFKLVSKSRFICNNCNHESSTTHEIAAPKVPTPSKCAHCNQTQLRAEHDFVTVMLIQLQDSHLRTNMERLDVLLFDNDTRGVSAGQIVAVKGTLRIVPSERGNKLLPMLFAKSIEYQNRDDLRLDGRDVNAFRKFAEKADLRGRLISMVAPNVVGHGDKKLCLLLSAIGAPESYSRGRINTVLIGPPGTAKSMLVWEATKMVPSSRYITAQNASGKSLTAIIDKENDIAVLRLGPIPLSEDGLCAINEIGSMNFEDQRFLQDVMEEGRFTIDKYGIHLDISARTTIIATANPYRVDWLAPKADKNEMPIRKELLDRFDLILVVRGHSDEQAMRDYADAKIEQESRQRKHNYNFMKKYIIHAKTIHPTFTESAKEMLKEFWVGLIASGKASNRTLDSLFRLSRAFARLYLKERVDESIAIEVMELQRSLLAEYGDAVQVVTVDPRDAAFEEVAKVISATKAPITFKFAVEQACRQNAHVAGYIGRRHNPSENKRLRNVYDMFLQGRGSPGIRVVQLKPLTLEWLGESLGSERSNGISGDASDHYDQNDRNKEGEKREPLLGYKNNELAVTDGIPKTSFCSDDILFLEIFSGLEKRSLDRTVPYGNLKRELISSGKFSSGEAYQATKDAVKCGILVEVDYELYGKSDTFLAKREQQTKGAFPDSVRPTRKI